MLPNGLRAAVLGSPIEHSLSPVLHAAAYQALGLDWEYDRHQVEVDQLQDFLALPHADVAGYSLTMPLKDEAFRIAHSADDAALETRACNTLIPEAGGWSGYNTDVSGFVSAFRRAGVENVGEVVIVGAGATARSAVAAVNQLGATTVTVLARRPEAIAQLAAQFPHTDVIAADWGSAEVASADTLISTVPAGAADALTVSADLNAIFDVVYAPWPTALVEKATADVVLGGLICWSARVSNRRC